MLNECPGPDLCGPLRPDAPGHCRAHHQRAARQAPQMSPQAGGAGERSGVDRLSAHVLERELRSPGSSPQAKQEGQENVSAKVENPVLEITRTFDATPAEVFNAWLNREEWA